MQIVNEPTIGKHNILLKISYTLQGVDAFVSKECSKFILYFGTPESC